MTPLKPGWYCFLGANFSDKVALDRSEPFDTLDDLVAWITASKLEYRPRAEVYEHAVIYFNEMSDQESDRPWATAIHKLF